MLPGGTDTWVRWWASDKEFVGFEYSTFTCCWKLYENTEQEAAGGQQEEAKQGLEHVQVPGPGQCSSHPCWHSKDALHTI